MNAKAPAKAAQKARAPLKARPAPPVVAWPSFEPLARLPVDIPLVIESDLRPMLAAASGQSESDGAWFGLRERLGRLGLAQGFDELLCLPHLRGLDTFWHQTETARKVLKQFRGRVLLADEVGLGKTVEAGMVLKEYLLRGMAERVLALVPAPLVGQWREELATKFDIACVTTHDALSREDPDRFWAAPRIIASLAMARRKEHAERLLAQSFDIVIVDEAHHLRDRASASYKLVDALSKRFLLLLSATPVQNNLIELYNLLTLLKPGMFKTQKEFRAAYMTPGKPRQPANASRLRDLLRGAMIRNTRAVVALKLPRRHAATHRVDPSGEELSLYQETADRIRALAADGARTGHRLALHHLLSAAGSSPAAASAAIARFAERASEDPAWMALAARWAALGAGGKQKALLDLLARNPGEKKLVFVPSQGNHGQPRGPSGPGRRTVRALRRRPERPREGRRDRRLPRSGRGSALHRVGRRRPQHPVLQHADQFRRPVESHGHRAAHRSHRPHRPDPRGVRVQPRRPRDHRGAGAQAARREDQHVRAGGR